MAPCLLLPAGADGRQQTALTGVNRRFCGGVPCTDGTPGDQAVRRVQPSDASSPSPAMTRNLPSSPIHPRTARSIDRRRRLTPRDYLVHPHGFGIDSRALFVVPAGGDHVSMEVARLLHQCFVAFRRAGRSSSGAALARRFGFSKQSWSAAAAGQRWPGHTIVIALMIALNESRANTAAASGNVRGIPNRTSGARLTAAPVCSGTQLLGRAPDRRATPSRRYAAARRSPA